MYITGIHGVSTRINILVERHAPSPPARFPAGADAPPVRRASLDTECGLNLDRGKTKGGETMSQKTKLRTSFREAVADIADGSTIAFGGFAMPGTPFNLIRAL